MPDLSEMTVLCTLDSLFLQRFFENLLFLIFLSYQ